MIVRKQVTITLRESSPVFPYLSRLNTYHHTILVLDGPTEIDGLRVVGLEWNAAGTAQRAVMEDGTRRRK